MRTISIETSTHGRVLVKDAVDPSSGARLLVGFHGYAQTAEDMMAELERIPNNQLWTLVSVQGLHRFYLRGGSETGASWMTRQDRELAIADNIVYVNRVIATVLDGANEIPIVFAGFSQGVAMAYRAGVLGSHRARGIVAVGGDVPPDVKSEPAGRFPQVFIGVADSDGYYLPEKVDADEAFLNRLGVKNEVFRYPGGHEWTDALRERVAQALQGMICFL